MRAKIRSIINSSSFIVILGLVIVPLASFILITLSEESPLYASISRIAWALDLWWATFIWGMIVMISNLFMTYKTFSISPLSDRTKGILTACQFVNIGLVFIGCLAFPAKTGDGETLLINHLHDIVTISAWVLYGIGLIVFSFLLHKKDRFLGLLGMGLMFFTVFSSVFFVRRVIHPDSYVGASAISEVHIINSLFIFLTVMYVAEDYARREASTAHTP